MNWWAITTIAFWVLGTISSIYTKDTECLEYSIISSCLLGILYLIKYKLL